MCACITAHNDLPPPKGETGESEVFLEAEARRLYALCVAVIAATVIGYALRPSSSNATKAALAHPQATLTSLTDPSSQEFGGEVTDAGCGTTDFTVHPASTVNVTVTAATPTNDLMVNLWYGGQIVHNEDTGVGQETFTYSVDDTAGGTYTVEVCKSGNPATPFMPAGGPYPYDGVFTDVDASTENPYAPPGSTTNPVTVIPTPSYGTWNAKFSSATVVDPQRTEGEPLDLIDSDGTFWESGPWGTHNQNSFIHRSTNDGQEFHLVADTGLRPDLPPGGGDTDIATDDHGNVYFTDLEALANLGTSVSHDNGMTWTKNPAAVQNTAVDRQWYAVDNGPSSSAVDNTVFLAFHQTAVGTFIYSSPGSTGATDPIGGLVWQNSSSNPGALGPLAADAICAQLRFDPVQRNLYYACNEGNHIRVTVGHVGVGQRTGIQYANFNGPRTPGGGIGAQPLPVARDRQRGERLHRLDRQDELEPLLLVLDRPGAQLVGAGARELERLGDERVRLGAGGERRPAHARVVRHAAHRGRRLRRDAELARRSRRRDRVPVVRLHRARQGREHREAADPADALHVEADALRRDLQLGNRLHDESDRRPADGRLLRLRGRAGRRPADRLQRHDQRVRRRRPVRDAPARRDDASRRRTST